MNIYGSLKYGEDDQWAIWQLLFQTYVFLLLLPIGGNNSQYTISPLGCNTGKGIPGSFQPRSPKLCPEGTQIFFQFLIPWKELILNSSILEKFWIFQILQNSQKFPILCVWAHFQEAKFWHRNKIRVWATDILNWYSTLKTNQIIWTEKLFWYNSYFIGLSFFEKIFFFAKSGGKFEKIPFFKSNNLFFLIIGKLIFMDQMTKNLK